LVWLWRFEGLVVQFLLLRLGGALLNHYVRPFRETGTFRWHLLRSLVLTGLPIFVFGYLSDVARTFPRLVLLALGGVHWVGLFAPASAVLTAVTMVPGAVGTYLYPQMTFRLAKTGDPDSVWAMARVSAVGALVLGCPVAAALAVVVPPTVNGFFPAYTASIPAIQWTLVAGIFMGAGVAVNALASLKAQRSMMLFVAVRLLLCALLPWFGGRHYGLTGVAAGLAAASAADFALSLLLIRSATRRPVQP
jgi:O-antigen/teichoic acid export membrane protein